MRAAIKDYSALPAGIGTFCEECGDLTTEEHYHCYICQADNFDLCPHCFDLGIRCWKEEHLVVKRTVKGGILAEAGRISNQNERFG